MAIGTQTAGTLGRGGDNLTGNAYVWGQVKDVYRTPSVIANEALWRLMPQLFMPLLARKHNQSYFADKIGTTINIKRPYATKAAKGRTMVIQEKIERIVPVTIDERWHWATSWTDENMTFNIKNLNDDFFKAGIEQLAIEIERDGFDELMTQTYINSGTVGTGMTSAIAESARSHAADMIIPKAMSNYLMMDPADITSIGKDVLGKGSAESFAQQLIRDRYKGNLSQFHVIEAPLMPAYKVADEGTSAPKISAANQRGSTLTVKGFDKTKNGSVILKKGTLIQMDNVKELQPRTLENKGRKATFTVTKDVMGNASGIVSVPIEPELNDGNLTVTNGAGTNVDLTAYQNVSGTPPLNEVVKILGTPGKTYNQSIFWQSDCMDFINVRLASPIGINWGQKTDPQTGVTMSVAAQGDIKQMTSYVRIDCVWVFKCLRPDLAVRVITGAVN